MTAVELTVGVPNFGGWSGGDWPALAGLAAAAEDAGIDRIVVNDHVVMGRRTDAYVWGRFPTAPEGPWLEPLTVLAAMAARTTRIRLSTGILIAPLRPAALLAKSVATLDVISGGRVDLGVGVGWQEEEYAAQGLEFAARGRMLDDTVAACRALWSDLPAEFASETVTFTDTFCSPLPAQPRLPVWFAGTLNARMLRRIREWGDGWIPIMGATTGDVGEGAARLAETGRAIGVQATVPLAVADDGRRDIAATMAGVPELVAAGATSIYLNVAAFAPTIGDAPGAFHAIAGEFRKII